MPDEAQRPRADLSGELRTMVRELLDVRVWTAFDIDAAGRVLAGNAELGSLQVLEIGP